jgi:hypothetical protein
VIRRTCQIAAATFSLLLPLALSAQTMSERGYEPVDQLVDDVDPLSRSLRLREDGLQAIGQNTTVFRPKGPGDHDRYYYVSYGVTAAYQNRSLYGLYRFQNSDQPVLLQEIPPDTVFHIGLPPSRDTEQRRSVPLPESYVDARVDGRAVGVSATEAVESMAHYAAPHRRRQQWQRFNDQARTQRQLVLRTLDSVQDTNGESASMDG